MQKLVGNLPKGLLFIMSAPAGTGKTTLMHKLVEEFPTIIQSISYTTRKPRPGEINGVHYNFISEEEFKQKIKADDFLEYANVYENNFYGTSKKWVEERRNEGKHVFLVIDTQGAEKVMAITEATSIFVMPPTYDTLKLRLHNRQTESIEDLEKRLNWARSEIAAGQEYNYMIINDNLDIAYKVLKSIVIAEEHKFKKEIPCT